MKRRHGATQLDIKASDQAKRVFLQWCHRCLAEDGCRIAADNGRESHPDGDAREGLIKVIDRIRAVLEEHARTAVGSSNLVQESSSKKEQFELNQMCLRNRASAIFIPLGAYAELRKEISNAEREIQN